MTPVSLGLRFFDDYGIRCTEPVLPSPVGLTHIGGHDRDAAEVGGADRGLA